MIPITPRRQWLVILLSKKDMFLHENTLLGIGDGAYRIGYHGLC